MCKLCRRKMTSLDETAMKNMAKTLRHAGRKLLKVHSVDKLLEQLDKLELLLSTMDQEPTEPIQESLVPVMKALISDELLKHTDEDVKISVTSCIAEITRITAPEVPYDDEQMKEIFKLMVASFEKLSDISGRGYEKALAILDNVNTVRLCLVMLDLECNDLIIEMFQHFLRFVRSNHPENAKRSMESIMTLIFEESEQISPDLLQHLLDSVGNENQTISPISWTLGQKVMRNCAVKLKPHLMKAVELSGRAPNQYAAIVSYICTNESKSPEHHESNNSKKTKEPKSENQLNPVPRKRDRKPNSLMNAEEGYDHSWIYRERNPGKSALPEKAQNCSSAFPSSGKPTSRKDKLNRKHKPASEALVSELMSQNKTKSAQSSRTDNIGNDFPPNNNPTSNNGVLSKPEDTSKGCEALASNPKTDENTDTAPSINNNIPGVHSNSVSALKEDNFNPLLGRTSLDSPMVRLEKESEVRKDSAVKAIKKIKFSLKFGGKIAVAHESVVVEPDVSCEDEGKQKSFMSVMPENIEEGRSTAATDVQKRRRLNPAPNKGLNKSSDVKELIAESSSKTYSGVKETPQARPSRRHIPVSVEASESCEQDNSLVGRQIKVWWPMDKTFYEGVINSYDAIKGKHKILYTDGEVEVLNLKKQRWELVAVDVTLDEEGLALQKLAEASDIAEKGKEKSKLESAKGANINSKSSRGRASARNSKSESAVKSVDTSAVDRSHLTDDSPITVGRKDSAKKPKTKRMKTGSDTKKNKRGTDDLE